MWASQVEVTCVVRVCNVHVLVNLPEGLLDVGERDLALCYVLKYYKSHFTLAKLHVKKTVRGHTSTCKRVGM